MKLSNISDFDLADSIAQAIFETENVNEALKVIKKKIVNKITIKIIKNVQNLKERLKN